MKKTMEKDLLAGLRSGINIGNSLDCFTEDGRIPDETVWGNPRISRELIRVIAESGFSILRVPVTWDGHFIPDGSDRISPEWMNRVTEVVQWGLEEGMTVILNTHHEFRWLRAKLSRLTDILPRYRNLWRQIADHFQDMDPRLIFQGTNEPNLMGGDNCAWGSGNRDVRAAINAINHTFVRTVRESGGNNAVRRLCIPCLAARPLPDCMRDMIIPKDDHLLFTVHCYCPDRFVFSRGDRYDTPFFDEKARDEVLAMFDDIRQFGLSHGVPMMITEFGAVAKKLPDGSGWNTQERIRFLNLFLRTAWDLGIPCVWWDNNYLETGDEAFALFDRGSLTCRFPELVQVLTGS